MKKTIALLKTLLVLALIAVSPAKSLAHELYSSSDFKQDPNIATNVGDFDYFFYASYDFGGKEWYFVATMAVYRGTSGDAVLPSKVTAPGGQVFDVIGIDYRFQMPNNYKNCTKLTIPNSVMVIEEGAFNDIDQITHLTFEDGSTPLYCRNAGNNHSRYGAFTYMDGLQEVYMGRELTWNFEEYVEAPFYRNNDGSYFKVTVGPQVNTLHYHLFHHAHVNAVVFADSKTPLSIEEDVFSDCPDIARWYQYRQIISSQQFVKESSNLNEIAIGGHVTSIAANEFMNCYNVYSIDLGGASMLEGIGEHAFEDCDDVQQVVIPENVTYIGYEAFYDMDNLKIITFKDNPNSSIDMTGGFVFYGYDGYSKELQEVYLGRELKTKSGNENYEFADRNNIKKVTVGPGCTAIPDKLFQNCYNVHTIDMSKATALKSIGKYAFEDCDQVTSIFIPKSVTYIGYEAFYDIDKLVEITFEDGTGAIDMTEGAQFRAYDNANGNLRTVYLGRNLNIDVDGYQKDNFYNRNITNVTVGGLVTKIPDKLFYNNPFASITFNAGNGSLVIGEEAFVGDGNTTLTSIVIPTPVAYIGEDAFYDNTSLITLSLKTAENAWIKKNAFDNCEMIRTVMVDLGGAMSNLQEADCFEESIYSTATLRYNASDAEFVTTNEPWKSFTYKDGTYNSQITFDYNGIPYTLTQGNDGIFRYQNASGELQTFPLKDDVAINAPVDFVANVSYDRVITGEKWGTTIYLPFTMAKPENWALYTLPIAQTSTNGKITITEVETETIEAFTPYIVNPQVENPTSSYRYTFPTQEVTILAGNKEASVKSGKYQLTGAIDSQTGVNYLPTDLGEMKFAKTSANVGPYRAKLEYTESAEVDTLTCVIDLWKGNGTKYDPYLISNAEEWTAIHNMLMENADGKVFEGIYFKQTANIEVTQGIGVTGANHNKAFAGNYDGSNYILTCNIDGENEAAAPFYKINNASITNLHVTGTISGGIHSAGVAAYITNTIDDANPNGSSSYIRNCRVSADINCGGSSTNDAHGGGFVGHKGNSYIFIDNCLFDGKLKAVSNGIGDICLGSFIGWGDDTQIRINRSVEHGTYEGANDSQIAFSWTDNGSVRSYTLPENSATNCIATTSNLNYCTGVTKYYPLVSGTPGITIIPADRITSPYLLGGYSKTENGNYVFDDSMYTYSENTVKILLDYDHAWSIADVKVDTNDAIATDTKDVYTYTFGTLTRFATVTALFTPRWEGSGTEDDPWLLQSEEDFYCMKAYREAEDDLTGKYVDMTGKYFTVMPGTYNLAEDVQVDSRMTISGEVNLNTIEGTTLTAPKGIELSEGNTLTLGGDGTLTINNCDNSKSGIGAMAVGTLIINDGTINVTGGYGAAGLGGDKANINGGSITINGGAVNATGGVYAAGIGGGWNSTGEYQGAGFCGNIVINGGQVIADSQTGNYDLKQEGIGCGFNGAQGSLTLGWTDETDFVISTYRLPAITFAKAFKLEDTGEEATADNISGKKIIPDTERETTAIENASQVDNNQTTNDNTWYSLDGRRLTSKPSQKGIYIMGGRKIVVK